MIHIRPQLIKAFAANKQLIRLLGGMRIYYIFAPKPGEFPRITYFELNQTDEAYADDEAKAAYISMQFSIWTKETATLMPIVQEVNQTLEAIGFVRTSAIDLFEKENNVFHKALRYRMIQPK